MYVHIIHICRWIPTTCSATGLLAAQARRPPRKACLLRGVSANRRDKEKGMWLDTIKWKEYEFLWVYAKKYMSLCKMRIWVYTKNEYEYMQERNISLCKKKNMSLCKKRIWVYERGTEFDDLDHAHRIPARDFQGWRGHVVFVLAPSQLYYAQCMHVYMWFSRVDVIFKDDTRSRSLCFGAIAAILRPVYACIYVIFKDGLDFQGWRGDGVFFL
jgi:hypothetical protein